MEFTPMKLISPTSQTVALNGVAVHMLAGVEMEIAQRLVETALAQGCLMVGKRVRASSKQIAIEDESNPVLDAINILVEEANPDKFSRDGLPTVTAITKALGYKITAEQRDSAWDIFQTEA